MVKRPRTRSSCCQHIASLEPGARKSIGFPAVQVPLAWSVLPAVAALVFYLALAPPATGDGDPGELALVLALNGVSHPTGYPLYTLLGHTFVRLLHLLGVGWAYAANAWSATGGGVAVFFLHALAARLIPARLDLGSRARFAIALVPTALFALNPAWTCLTTIAEVYSWQIALMAGMALRYVGLARRLGARDGARAIRLGREAAIWGLLCGLGLAHHLTTVWIAAPLSLAIAWMLARSRRPVPASVGIAAAAALVPLLSYVILYQRAQHPGPGVWPTLGASLDDVARHVTGAMYRYQLGRYAPAPRFQPLLCNDVYPFLVLSGALLAALVARTRGRGESMVGIGLLGAVFAATAFGFRYGVEDPSPYFLAPMVIGLAAVAPVAASLLAGTSVERILGRAALVGLLLVLALRSVPWVHTASERGPAAIAADQRIHRLWESIPSDSALVFVVRSIVCAPRTPTRSVALPCRNDCRSATARAAPRRSRSSTTTATCVRSARSAAGSTTATRCPPPA